MNQQPEEFQFQNGEKIIFCYDGKEEPLELKYLQESGLIREILIQHPPNSPQNPLTVTLPKWVSVDVFSVFNDYIKKKNLNSWTDRSIQLSDQSLQRLLWMGDYFQIDDFQYKCITDVLIPRIRVNNCLLFLNEAFKKLKACEDSCDIWYMLLNTGMNFTAKNLIHIFKNNPQELNKINNKIMEEIIERSLKYFKKKQNFDYKDMVDVILYIRNVQDCFELLFVQRKNIVNRRINYSNHPSISWKLSNISSIINKETNPFKFNEYQWKLVAKMEDDKVTGKILRIYLKLESSVSSSSSSSNQQGQNGTKPRHKTAEIESNSAAAGNDNDPSKDPFKKIIAIYFLLKLNDKEYSTCFNIKHIIIERAPQILLCEFEGQQLKSFENKKLEFTVYLNTDYIYSLLLNYISKSIDSFTNNPNFSMMSEDDIVAIVKSLPYTVTHQEKAFQIAQLIVSQQNNPVSNAVELFKGIDYNSISMQSLNNFQNQKKFRITPELKKLIDGEVTKKMNGGSSTAKQVSSQTHINVEQTSQRDSSNVDLFLNTNQFELQKRDTEGPAESDGFTFNRPENNFRQYMQRNDSQDIRKKTLSQDQFGMRRNISEDQGSNIYNFNQTPSGTGIGQERGQQDLPINKLDKLKKTNSTNASIPDTLGSPFPPSYTMGSDSKSFSQQQSSNFNSSQKMQVIGSPNLNPQSSKIGPFIPPSIQNQSQLNLQNNSMNFLKSPQQQQPLQANVHSSPQPQQLMGSQNSNGSAMKQNHPPHRPSSSSSSQQYGQDQNPFAFERENRKKQMLNELDLKKYVLNQNLLNELQDISIY